MNFDLSHLMFLLLVLYNNIELRHITLTAVTTVQLVDIGFFIG